MNKFFITGITLLVLQNFCFSQPVALRTDIAISHIMNVQAGVTRVAFNAADNSMYYSTYDGNIYRIEDLATGTPHDSLVYTISDHGLQYVQGFMFHGADLYVSGNNEKNTPLTRGIIMRGSVIAGDFREWVTVAQTVPYETADAFDHLFSGITLNPAGDTILICSGSRGDHGEEETRFGAYPGLRNAAVTSLILQIPANAQNLVIPNDSALLDAGGFVFARGIRNTYDFAYNATGDLFGVENSGDRDMEDEINWLRSGRHYGFPWMMGGSHNPQQYSWFDPSVDLLINHDAWAWQLNAFHNDSLFPQIPQGLNVEMPCKNYGPDAAYMRDSATGNTYNAALVGEPIYSFTPHRSPLGLTFDKDSILGSDFRGNGFVLSYTRGNASLSDPSALLAPFADAAEDLLMLVMEKSIADDSYSFHSYKVVEGLNHPVDAVLLDSCMYVIETDFSGTQSLWRIDFPKYVAPVNLSVAENNASQQITAFPNPANENINFSFSQKPAANSHLKIVDQTGRLILENPLNIAGKTTTVQTSALVPGFYFWQLNETNKGHFIVRH